MAKFFQCVLSAGFVAILFLTAGAFAENADALDNGKLFDFEHVSCNGGPNEIRIVVENVKKSVGLITADLYPNIEDGFLKRRTRMVRVRFAARAPQTAFCMRAPTEDLYAVAVYHDENANRRLDKGMLGIPAEPFGVSNDPPMRFGPPTAADSVFKVASAGAKVKIILKN